MYRYRDLLTDVKKLGRMGAETGSIGKSVLGQDIPYAFVGSKEGPAVVVVGATHAREHITARLVAKQALRYATGDLRLDGGIYFVPMHNPDGVRICQEGVGFIQDAERREFILEANGGSEDFTLWKANAAAVDLNVNFDARWGTGKQNLFFPAPFNYVGKAPMSEPETKAIAALIEKTAADYVITYHTKGEIIYWQFNQQNLRKWRDYRYARFVAAHTGYKLVGQGESAGGLKDWCVEALKIPAITVEVGSDRYGYPYPYSQFDDILARNMTVPQRMLNTLAKEKRYGKKVYECGDK